MKTIFAIIVLFIATVHAGLFAIGGGFAAEKPPIYFENGNVGVNFAGYHASAGLGGLLNGGAAGGLHAEAGTPFGQAAKAGLGGVVGSGGGAGGLYAGATAGGDVAAEAGIGGSQVVGGAVGGSFAGSSAGGVTKYVSKTVEAPVIVEHEIHAKPVVQKTYVERTVIPNYVEKKIQVPSYVEKTVRVPTVVEKTVRVAAPPTIIEKTVEIPSKPAVSVAAGVEGGGHVESVNVAHKSVTAHHGGGAFGGLFASAGVGGGLGAGAGIGGGGIAGGSSSGVYRAEITKVANPGFINDVFNIPISTLHAVNKLVGGIVGGSGGSITVAKHYSAY